MRSLTSFGTLARTVSNLLKDPDLPGLQDIFTEPSHTEEKIHLKPLSLFTKKNWAKKLKAFLRGVSCVPSKFPLMRTLIQNNQMLSVSLCVYLCDVL